MATKLAVFQSLNCPLCKSVFAKSTHDSKSPQQLNCGKVVCEACWQRDFAVARKDRKHQCDYTGECYEMSHFPALCLIELLNHQGIMESTNADGYLLSEMLTIPECPVCQEDYSLASVDRKPYVLDCGHALCNGCFGKIKTNSNYSPCPYHAVCPLCRSARIYRQLISRDNGLQEFLRELPEMAEQIAILHGLSKHQCEGCQKEKSLNKLFHCIECKKAICSRCVINSHRTHETEDYVNEELRKVNQRNDRKMAADVHLLRQTMIDMSEEFLRGVSAYDKSLKSKFNESAESLEAALKKEQELSKLSKEIEEIARVLAADLSHAKTKVQRLSEEIEKMRP